MAETKNAIVTPLVQRDNIIAATVVPGVSTEMGTIHTQGATRLFVQMAAAVAPLTGFAIKARAVPGGTYDTLFSAAADFLSPSGIMVGASGDLTTLAAGARGWFIMDVRGLESVQVFATSGGTATLALDMGAV